MDDDVVMGRLDWVHGKSHCELRRDGAIVATQGPDEFTSCLTRLRKGWLRTGIEKLFIILFEDVVWMQGLNGRSIVSEMVEEYVMNGCFQGK